MLHGSSEASVVVRRRSEACDGQCARQHGVPVGGVTA